MGQQLSDHIGRDDRSREGSRVAFYPIDRYGPYDHPGLRTAGCAGFCSGTVANCWQFRYDGTYSHLRIANSALKPSQTLTEAGAALTGLGSSLGGREAVWFDLFLLSSGDSLPPHELFYLHEVPGYQPPTNSPGRSMTSVKISFPSTRRFRIDPIRKTCDITHVVAYLDGDRGNQSQTTDIARNHSGFLARDGEMIGKRQNKPPDVQIL